MPLVTVLNLKRADDLHEIEQAIRQALTSMPELEIKPEEVDLAPVLAPDRFSTNVTRINVDLWIKDVRTKGALQELAMRVGIAFRAVTDESRHVKVVIRPYDVGLSGWVSLD